YFLHNFNISMNKTISGISALAQEKLMGHHWPGNVRELRNVIERALILETSGEIQPMSLPDFRLERRLSKAGVMFERGMNEPVDLDGLMADYERKLILEFLEQNEFNIGRTADRLKITRHSLHYRMQRLNIPLSTEAEAEAGTAMEKGKIP